MIYFIERTLGDTEYAPNIFFFFFLHNAAQLQ